MHRDQGDGSEADPDVADVRVASADEGADRLDCDVDGDYEEARPDEPLRPPLGKLRRGAATSEPPEEHKPRERLDEGIRPEPDESNRSRHDPGRTATAASIPCHPTPSHAKNLALRTRNSRSRGS